MASWEDTKSSNQVNVCPSRHNQLYLIKPPRTRTSYNPEYNTTTQRDAHAPINNN